MSGAAGGSAAAAAAAEARRQREEEEEMTPYGRDDLVDDWEFKILRSTTGAFKRPATLQQVLEEEAQAGWVFVEKFDNSRIRLKRPASARKSNVNIGYDPYRTYVGLTEGQLAMIVVACVLAGLGAVGIVIAVIAALA